MSKFRIFVGNIPPASGGPTNATLNVTDDADTLAATVTAPVAGVGTAADAADTAAGTATAPVVGTGTAADGTDTATGTGQATVQVTAGITDDADTISSDVTTTDLASMPVDELYRMLSDQGRFRVASDPTLFFVESNQRLFEVDSEQPVPFLAESVQRSFRVIGNRDAFRLVG